MKRRVRGAALPEQLHVPARRLASAGAGRARRGARLSRARDHRRVLGGGRGARSQPPRRSRACSSSSAASSAWRTDLLLVLLATSRRGYGHLCRLITRARLAAEKGSYRLTRAMLAETMLDDCLALWVPGEEGATEGEWLKKLFPGRLWIAVELLRGGNDRTRLARLQALGVELGLPLVAATDVHMHVRERRALQDVLTAIRLGVPVSQAGHALARTASGICASRPGSNALSAGAARRDCRHRRALHFLARRAALRVSRGTRARGRDAHHLAAQAHRGRRARALAAGRAGKTALPDRTRARADRRAALRAVLPHRARHRPLRAQPRHPVPGPRLGGQLRRLLLPRHHRGRSGAPVGAVRALHLARSATSRPTSTSTSSTSGAKR